MDVAAQIDVHILSFVCGYNRMSEKCDFLPIIVHK